MAKVRRAEGDWARDPEAGDIGRKSTIPSASSHVRALVDRGDRRTSCTSRREFAEPTRAHAHEPTGNLRGWLLARYSVVLALVAAMWSMPLAAQDQRAVPQLSTPTFQAGVDLVALTVTVTDQQQKYLSGL